MTFSVLTEVDLWHVDKKQNLRCYNVQYGSYYYYYYVSVVSNMPFLLHLSSFVLSRWKPICMGLYLAPCHIVGIQWLTLWNWLKTGGPETKRVDLSFLICPTCLSCDDVMKHRKWLGRSPSPPLPPPPQSREQEMGDKVWQVQKELEELQARSHGTAEVPTRLTQFRRVVRHVRRARPVGGRVPFLAARRHTCSQANKKRLTV